MFIESKSNVRSIRELMLGKFQKYYQENQLFKQADRVLLTVSGGKDSMTMLYLFKAANLNFGVAHCNFRLRGESSIKDEVFVRQICKTHNIKFHSIAFDTNEYAQENGISIQMAARNLRYGWFEKIRKENNYSCIATAHHKNDIAETMLINLTSGTGLSGLHGIRKKRGVIIRPLLCFDSFEIETYVKEHNTEFRQDASNANTKYTRNAIRHNIIPELEKINPSFIETIVSSSNYFSELEEILNQKIEAEKERLFVKHNGGFKIDIELLKKISPLKTYLYYFLKPFNYNSADVLDIIRGLGGQSGQTFYSATHQIVKDRTHLLLNEIIKEQTEVLEIKSLEEFPFDYELLAYNTNFEIKKENKYAYLDADRIKFPLYLRTWIAGDVFQPLGMKGNKKVSDFLIDSKVSVVDKQSVQVLLQEREIVWLVGHRVSDNYCISGSTKKVLIISV